MYVLAEGRYTGRMNTSVQRDNARLWRVEVFGGLDLLRASFVQFTFSPHAHEEFMIAVTESGAATPRIWGGVQRIVSGDVIVLSPGVVHSGGPAAESFVFHADCLTRMPLKETQFDIVIDRNVNIRGAHFERSDHHVC